MRKIFLQIVTVLAGLTIIFTLPSCGKDDNLGGLNGIQTGDTTVSIYTQYYPSFSELRIKYNYVIPTDISAVVRFYLHGQGQKDIAFTIPAGNQNPQSEINGQYLNNLVYSRTNPNTWTQANGPSLIDASWQIDSVKIIGVHTADKHYGFKVLGKDDSWPAYFEVQNPKTIIAFTYNNKPLHFEKYDFEAGGGSYSTQLQDYAFYFFDHKIQMFTAEAAYPLKDAMVIDVPILVFYDQINYGGAPDNPDGSNDTYSTIKLKISNVTDSHFDGSFEGKLFSSRQTDTLYIKDGIIKNAPLPGKEQLNSL